MLESQLAVDNFLERDISVRHPRPDLDQRPVPVPANLERIAPTRCTIDATLDQAGQTYHVKSEQPGMGAFYKDGNGDVINTYSCYARGLDILIGAYNFLGLTPKGRNERG